MPRRSAFNYAAVAALLASSGCEVIGGIEELKLKPTPPEGCAISSAEQLGAGVRLGNVSPGSPAVDLCAVNSGGSFDGARALLEWSGEDCPDGVPYKKLTAPLGLPPGRYDFKVIEAGQGCGSAGLGEPLLEQEVLADGSTSVYLFGDGQVEPYRLGAFRDAEPDRVSTFVRFVNGVSGLALADCGVLSSDAVQLAAAQTPFRDVPFAGVAAQTTPDEVQFPIDEAGYLVFRGASIDLDYGVAASGEQDPLFVLPTRSNIELEGVYTIFASGLLEADGPWPLDMWACDETSVEAGGVFAVCGHPRELAFEVFSTQLTDLFTPYIDERAPHVIQELRTLDADVVCINELYRPADREAAREAADANPHFTRIVAGYDLLSAPGTVPDYTDQRGTQALFAQPPCTGESVDLLRAAIEHMTTLDCLEVDERGEHVFGASGSAAVQCVLSSVRVLAPFTAEYDEDKYGCYACAITALSGYASLERAEAICTTAPADPADPVEQYVFDRSPGLMLLSHYPFASEPELRLLPSTGWQTGVIRAPIEIDNGEVVDFYCASHNVFASQNLLPYTGRFGDGASFGSPDAAQAEQQLEADRMLAFIAERSAGNHRRVVLGASIYSGIEVTNEEGEVLVQGYRPEIYRSVAAELELLTMRGYTPRCNVCPDNGGGAPHGDPNVWTTHLWGRGVPPEDVLSTVLTFQERKVDVGRAELIPVTQHYGIRSVVRVAQ